MDIGGCCWDIRHLGKRSLNLVLKVETENVIENENKKFNNLFGGFLVVNGLHRVLDLIWQVSTFFTSMMKVISKERTWKNLMALSCPVDTRLNPSALTDNAWIGPEEQEEYIYMRVLTYR